MLDRLVADVLARNTTIAQASARLNAARADARMIAADASPQVSLDGGVSEAGGPLINAAGGSGTLFTARASLSWELDLSGRLSDSRAAARLDAAAADAMLRDARLLIVADTIQAYWRAQFLAADAELAGERVALGERLLERALQRQTHGLAASEAPAIAQAGLSRARGDLVEIKHQYNLAIHQLQFLAGSSEPLAIAPLSMQAPPEIPSGLPSEMLARRPDVSAAQAEFLAADKRLAAARKSWLPRFSLTASGGAASPSLGQFLGATAQSFGLNLLFGLPLFDGGRHKAIVGHRRADVELAAARYAERVLGALREVNDALASVAAARQTFALASADAARLREVCKARQASASNGLGTQSAAEACAVTLLASRQGELAANFARYDAALEVIRSLGGGW